MNRRYTARLKFDARQVAKNAIYTAFICNFRFQFTHTFLSQKLFMHFFVTKRIYAHFFLSWTRFTRFFAKMISALRQESFCALKVAIRKVQTFWASGDLIGSGNILTNEWGGERETEKNIVHLGALWWSESSTTLPDVCTTWISRSRLNDFNLRPE